MRAALGRREDDAAADASSQGRDRRLNHEELGGKHLTDESGRPVEVDAGKGAAHRGGAGLVVVAGVGDDDVDAAVGGRRGGRDGIQVGLGPDIADRDVAVATSLPDLVEDAQRLPLVPAVDDDPSAALGELQRDARPMSPVTIATFASSPGFIAWPPTRWPG